MGLLILFGRIRAMDAMQFTPIKQRPVSKRVSEQIKTLIIEGNLKSADKLQSERELAKTIQVGRLSQWRTAHSGIDGNC
jgi:DNA-binding GntR family transcriptional regulator